MERVRQALRERRLLWDGSYNMRDIGGYPLPDGTATRWSTILRGDTLGRLRQEGRRALRASNVKTIVDLRSPAERVRAPHEFARADDPVPRYLALPLIDDEDAAGVLQIAVAALPLLYRVILDRYPGRFAAIIDAVVAAPEGAVLVHCQSGKDRTGLVVALLLDLVGVSRETIVADYALSDTLLRPLYEARGQALPPHAVSPARRPAHDTSPPAAMEQFLIHLDGYGGAAEYLRAAGVSDADLDRLRRRLRTG